MYNSSACPDRYRLADAHPKCICCSIRNRNTNMRLAPRIAAHQKPAAHPLTSPRPWSPVGSRTLFTNSGRKPKSCSYQRRSHRRSPPLINEAHSPQRIRALHSPAPPKEHLGQCASGESSHRQLLSCPHQFSKLLPRSVFHRLCWCQRSAPLQQRGPQLPRARIKPSPAQTQSSRCACHSARCHTMPVRRELIRLRCSTITPLGLPVEPEV